MPIADFEALMETLDVLGEPTAMKAIHAAQKGKSTCRPLDLDDKNFGLRAGGRMACRAASPNQTPHAPWHTLPFAETLEKSARITAKLD